MAESIERLAEGGIFRTFRAALFGLACALAGAGSPSNAFGVEASWDGAVETGDWLVDANWTPAEAPSSPGDVAYFLEGSSTYDVALDTAISLKQLALGDPTRLGVSGTGQITFDDPLDAGAAIAIPRADRWLVFDVPVAVASSEPFTIISTGNSHIDFNQGLAGAGELTMRGGGAIRVDYNATGWSGPITIDQGLVSFPDSGGLVDSNAEILVRAGGRIQTPRGQGYSNRHLVLDGGSFGVSGLTEGEWNGPIEVRSDSEIASSATLTINSAIVGDGGLRLGGGSNRLRLMADNTYRGETTIVGAVDAFTSMALGSSEVGTVVAPGGRLNLHTSIAEPITLRGGEVPVTSNASSTGGMTIEHGTLSLLSNTVFETPVVLASPTEADDSLQPATVNGWYGSFSVLTGGVSGVGDLRVGAGPLIVRETALSHDGSLLVTGELVLETANTYTGPTLISSGGQLTVNSVGALGTSDAPIEVIGSGSSSSAELVINAPIDRDIEVSGSGIVRVETPIVVSSDIHFGPGGGSLHGVATFDGTITLGSSPFTPGLRGGVFRGDITGAGDVSLGGDQDTPVTLESDNSYLGSTRIYDDVNANSPRALGSSEVGTAVSDGTLRINAATDEPLLVFGGEIELNAATPRLPQFASRGSSNPQNASQRVVVNTPGVFDHHADVYRGTLEVNTDVTVRSLTLREASDDGKIKAGPGATLTVLAPEIEIHSGGVEGSIAGAEVIRKLTSATAFFSNPLGFDGQIDIERGVLRASNSEAFGSIEGNTRVGPRGAVLEFYEDVNTHEDIYLDNAHGVNNTGALRVVGDNSNVTLNGSLHLGDQGSLIGSREPVFLNGPIVGGGLTTVGDDTLLRVTGGQNTYTGETDIRGGMILVEREGRLRSTSKIVIRDNGDSVSDRGILRLSNHETAVADRINDDAPIHLRGGVLEADDGVDETMGSLSFLGGESTVDPEESRFVFAEISRELGAVADIRVSAVATIEIDGAPASADGFYPWMLVEERLSSSSRPNGFGKVEAGQVKRVESNAPLSNASTAGEDAYLNGVQFLGADITVRSLYMDRNNGGARLAGNLLTIESGGLIGNSGIIADGRLTSGSGELILQRGVDLDVDIIDDGSQPVTLTMGEGAYHLRGENSFSGGVYGNRASVILYSENALPEGTDVQLVGGELTTRYESAVAKQLGTVRVASDAEFRGEGGVRFRLQEVALEEGVFAPGEIEGGGVIRKTTVGEATLSGGRENGFTGDVIVEEGRLNADHIESANVIVRGGQLAISSLVQPVRMEGGTLVISNPVSGDITVAGGAEFLIETPSFSSNPSFSGTLAGAAPLKLTSNSGTFDVVAASFSVGSASPDYSGDVSIDSLNVGLGADASLGSGEITVGPAGELRVGSPHSDGEVRNFPNRIRLAGGVLDGVAGNGDVRFTGDITVEEGASFLGSAEFAGALHLLDGAIAATLDEYGATLSGDVIVHGEAELRLGRTKIRSSALRLDRGAVTLSGVIKPGESDSVLRIVNSGFDTLDFQASVETNSSASLQLLYNGAPQSLVFDQPNQQVRGAGSIFNTLSVSNGAEISPGESAGTLTVVGDVSIGPGAVYRWESSFGGSPGVPGGWDMLQVEGELSLLADSDSPWTLIVTPENVGALATGAWLVASASSISGFDPSAVAIDVSGMPGSWGAPWVDFALEQQGGDLFLTVAIPEPTAASLLSVLAMGIVGRLSLRARPRS